MGEIVVNPYQFTLNRRIWCFIVFAVLVIVFYFHAIGMKMNVWAALEQIVYLVMFSIVAFITCYVKRNDLLFFYSICYSQIILMYFIGSFACYLGATLNFPLVDQKLFMIDRALGFDWQNYLLWMDRQAPWVIDTLKFSYYSFMVQTCFVISTVFFLNRPDHGQRVVLAVIFSCLATALISAIFPALGMYGFLHIDTADFPKLHPHLARVHEEFFFALRNRTIDTIYYPSQGIITMPSFHTIMAVLFIYASWPFRLVRLFVVPNNILLAIAAPIYGGHYFIDIFVGFMVAFLSIAFAKHILPNNTYVCIVKKENARDPIIDLSRIRSRYFRCG